jgi:hypothetical protein
MVKEYDRGRERPGQRRSSFRFGGRVTKMRVEELDEGRHVARQCTHSLPDWQNVRT